MLNAIMVWISAMVNNIRNWWNTNRQQIRQDLRDSFRRLDRFFDRLSRGILRMMVVSLVLKVASYFCPELPKRIPTIYGWCDGFLQFGEFALRTVLGSLYSLFTGNFKEFWSEYNEAFKELLQQLTTWLSTIRF